MSGLMKNKKLRYARIAARVCVRCGVCQIFGVQTVCENCETAKEAKQRRKNKEKSEGLKLNHKKTRDEVYEYYGGYRCVCCGCTHRNMLEIDHKNGGGHAHHKFIKLCGYRNIYHWLRHHGYPIGFQILCSSCNKGRHRNGGVCPHKGPDAKPEFDQEAFEVLRDIILKEAGGQESEIIESQRMTIAKNDITDEEIGLFREFIIKIINGNSKTVREIHECGVKEEVDIWPWNLRTIKVHLDIQIEKKYVCVWSKAMSWNGGEDTYSMREGWRHLGKPLSPFLIKMFEESKEWRRKVNQEELERQKKEDAELDEFLKLNDSRPDDNGSLELDDGCDF